MVPMKENVEKRTNRETKVEKKEIAKEKKEIAKEKKEIAKEKKEKEKRRPPLLLPVAKRSPTMEIQKENVISPPFLPPFNWSLR